jgi:hypothetical protein
LPDDTQSGIRTVAEGLVERRPFVRLWTVRHDDPEYRQITARRSEFYSGTLGRRAVRPFFNGLKDGDLLWDIPKPGKELLSDVKIVTEGEITVGAGPRLREMAEQFEAWVRKVRLFISPGFREQLRGLSKDDRQELTRRLRKEIRGVLGEDVA